MGGVIRVLHAVSDEAFSRSVSGVLEREDDRFHVETAETTSEVFARLETDGVDCILATHDPPAIDAIDVCATIQADHPHIPRFLLADAHHEEIASAAIEGTITDCCSMALGDGLGVLLAHRIRYTVDGCRLPGERERERYETIVETTGDAIYTLDAKGRFTYVNEAFSDITGFQTEELFGSHISMVMEMVDVERGNDLIRSLLSSARSRETFEMSLFTADGGRILCENHISVLPFDDDFRGTAGVIRDITRRKQREQQVQVLNRVLRHNVRNQLTIVRGCVINLADQLEADNRDVQETLEAVDRIIEMSRKVRNLDTSMDPDAVPQTIDLEGLIHNIVSDIRRTYPAATVTVDCPDDLVAETFPGVEFVLRELLENATKHARASPSVSVSVESDEQSVRFEISDDGPGLPDLESHVVIEGSEGSLVHGSGVGLWVVYWIVESHRGELDVIASEDGTTVSVSLPQPEIPT